MGPLNKSSGFSGGTREPSTTNSENTTDDTSADTNGTKTTADDKSKRVLGEYVEHNEYRIKENKSLKQKVFQRTRISAWFSTTQKSSLQQLWKAYSIEDLSFLFYPSNLT